MKKTVALLLLFVMVSSMLVACGDEKNAVTETVQASEPTRAETAIEKESVQEEEPAKETIPEPETEKITFTLPADYFCVDDSQDVSTQEQLDENSKNGLKYEFADDQTVIICTVTDQVVALKAVKQEVDDNFTDLQESYVKSYESIEYSDDLTEIEIICDKDKWNSFDGWYGMVFLSLARKYQQISGIAESEMNAIITYVDDAGNTLSSDNLRDYLD